MWFGGALFGRDDKAVGAGANHMTHRHCRSVIAVHYPVDLARRGAAEERGQQT